MLINLKKNKPDCIIGNGVDEDTIARAENKLSLQFSPEYHEFLAQFGMLMIDDHEIMGFGKTDRLSVVANTLSAREKDSDFPDSMYVIENLGIDRILILQASDGAVYEYVPHSVPTKIFSSLEEYLMAEE